MSHHFFVELFFFFFVIQARRIDNYRPNLFENFSIADCHQWIEEKKNIRQVFLRKKIENCLPMSWKCDLIAYKKCRSLEFCGPPCMISQVPRPGNKPDDLSLMMVPARETFLLLVRCLLKKILATPEKTSARAFWRSFVRRGTLEPPRSFVPPIGGVAEWSHAEPRKGCIIIIIVSELKIENITEIIRKWSSAENS